jgi:nitrate reductase gamma subunit
VPWLVSLSAIDPQIQCAAPLPLVIEMRFCPVPMITAVFPFTCLVDFASFPIICLWRPYQVVI